MDAHVSRAQDAAPDRLIESPVFILSAVRSGSTLLRCVLDTHSCIHAHHELYLADMTVRADDVKISRSLEASGLTTRELEHMLWDRMLHHLLSRSGKRIIVDKTPINVVHWRRLAECWPGARFVFLLRHPMHVLESMSASVTGRLGTELDMRYGAGNAHQKWRSPEAARSYLLMLLDALVEARASLPGLTLRYEELTADPETATQRLCDFLGVAWEPDMIEYGRVPHGPRGVFLGDDSERLDAGRVLPARPLPSLREVPHELHDSCRKLGYA